MGYCYNMKANDELRAWNTVWYDFNCIKEKTCNVLLFINMLIYKLKCTLQGEWWALYG